MNKVIYKPRLLLGCASSLTMLAALMASQSVSAHGYMSEPPSRALLCRQNVNTGCGGAQYEPASVGEAPKGFPGAGVAEGKIASGGVRPDFGALDIESATRWTKTEIKDRNFNFDWVYTTGHRTTKHEYFITRNGWNPNEVLGRATFESTPFCTVEGNSEYPAANPNLTGPAKEKHNCTIPSDKAGHHLILGLWTVDDTGGAFHNVADVNILGEATTPDGWGKIGVISASQTLFAGDKVKVRAFTATGESAEYSAELTIGNTEEGKPENWSLAIAEKINAAHKLIRAGVRDEAGNIEPVKGVNNLYAKAESGIVRFEQEVSIQDDPMVSLSLPSNLESAELKAGVVQYPFPVHATRKMNVEATLFDAKHKQVGKKTLVAEAQSNFVTLDVRSAPGAHHLMVVGTTEDGRYTRQASATIELTGEAGGTDYDAVFPAGVGSYPAGFKVLQEKNGQVYECKPFPYSGYCNQYSPTASQYEPGVGSHWQDAWELK